MLGPQKTSAAQGPQVWQRVIETAQGGFTIDKTGLVDGQLIPAGSPVGFNEGTRLARVIKTATLFAAALNTDTTYQVLKGHNFAIGEYFGAVIGGKAYAITAIDTTTNADHDVITIGTTLAVALGVGTVAFQSSATGSTAAALIVAPMGVMYRDVYVRTNEECSVVLRGTVYARRIPAQHASISVLLPQIIFSQSF